MKIADLEEIIKHALPPIQPWIRLNSKDYIEKLTDLNPVCTKSNALFYQFTTENVEKTEINIIPEHCSSFIFKCDSSKADALFLGINSKLKKITLEPYTTYFCVKPYSSFGTKGWKASPAEVFENQFELKDVLETNDLEFKIAEASSFNERVALFKDHFIKQWVDYDYEMSMEEYLAMILYKNYLSLSTDDIERFTGYSKRYCRKKFMLAYNISPQKYMNIIRFQSATNMLLNKKENYNMAEIAHENGYFDEAHFINDFKSYATISPKRFRKNIV
ncbi:helix-turn-helix domain-containing protein [Bacillus sp. JJ722]|uniref:helix-turn-helix domain-containing protein n=1 Tax=Bacillus sp. JJ722 TaxID=3122973 RepID=UPI003000E71F